MPVTIAGVPRADFAIGGFILISKVLSSITVRFLVYFISVFDQDFTPFTSLFDLGALISCNGVANNFLILKLHSVERNFPR